MPSLKFDIIVDGKGGSVALQQFANETDAAFKKSAAAVSKVSLQALPEHERAVVKVQRQYSNLQGEIRKLETSGRVSKQMADQWHRDLGVRMQGDLDALGKKGQQTFWTIANSAKVAAAVAATTLAGREIVQSTIGMERFENSLKSATGSSMQATREMAFVREEANRLGLELMATGKGFVTIAASAKGTELAGQGVRDIFSATSEAAAVLGLSADETNGALLAISQMISKGKVSAEELRGQLGERLPGAFQIAARAMGVTTQELDKMLQKGEIVATDFLPKFAAEMHKTFGPDLSTAAGRSEAAFNRLKNSITDLKVAIGNSGLLDSLAKLADIGSKSIQGWVFLGSTTTSAGKEFFQGEELDRYYAADLATRKKMLDHAAQVRSLRAMTAAPPQLGEVGIDPMIAAKRAKDTEEAEKDLKKQQTAAKQLADQWKSTSADLSKDIRVGGLDGLDKELATITYRAEELRKQFGGKGLIDAWQAEAENSAIQADYLERQKKEQQELLKITDAYHDAVTASLPEEQQAIAKITDEYRKSHIAVAEAFNAGKISAEEAEAAIRNLDLRQAEAVDHVKAKADTVAKAMDKAFTGWASNMAESLNDVLWGADFTFNNIAVSFGKMITQMQIQASLVSPLMKGFNDAGGMSGIMSWAWDGLMSVGAFHEGGVVGATTAPAMMVPPSLFVGPPRFHNGLMPDEFPAILQKGETVIPRDGFAGGGGNMTVNVIESPGNGGKINRTTDANGNRIIEVLVDRVKSSLALDFTTGDGVVPASAERAYGLNRVAGAY
ncbi:MAG: tape measure protein [Thermodesulfobacteriota bacterium]